MAALWHKEPSIPTVVKFVIRASSPGVSDSPPAMKLRARVCNPRSMPPFSKVCLLIISPVGIPDVADVESKVEVGGEIDFKWSTKETTTHQYKRTVKLSITPMTDIVATASVQSANVMVPFTITYITPNRVKFTSGGTWNGVTSWGVKVNFNETPIKKGEEKK